MAAETPTPSYDLVFKQGDIEVRDYGPMIVAETRTLGSRSAAISRGFQRLADYIFAKDRPGATLAMTAPVLQTATNDQGPQGEGAWQIGFIMPDGYSLADLPEPATPSIQLSEKPSRRLAAIRSTGFAWDSKLKDEQDALMAYLQHKKVPVTGPPLYAFYDPPWTPPWDKHHEVLVEIPPDSQP